MIIHETKISGVFVVDATPFTDHRGTFSRWYCENEIFSACGNRKIVQINHSCTHSIGDIRGMHFQYPPYSEMKLIRCISGCICDVVVDIRCNSPTFLKWHKEKLSAENQRMLVIPEGCAHGFQVLQGNSELLYLHTASYSPEFEGGLSPLDPRIGIEWPLPVGQMSERDKNHSYITDDFKGIEL